MMGIYNGNNMIHLNSFNIHLYNGNNMMIKHWIVTVLCVPTSPFFLVVDDMSDYIPIKKNLRYCWSYQINPVASSSTLQFALERCTSR